MKYEIVGRVKAKITGISIGVLILLVLSLCIYIYFFQQSCNRMHYDDIADLIYRIAATDEIDDLPNEEMLRRLANVVVEWQDILAILGGVPKTLSHDVQLVFDNESNRWSVSYHRPEALGDIPFWGRHDIIPDEEAARKAADNIIQSHSRALGYSLLSESFYYNVETAFNESRGVWIIHYTPIPLSESDVFLGGSITIHLRKDNGMVMHFVF